MSTRQSEIVEAIMAAYRVYFRAIILFFGLLAVASGGALVLLIIKENPHTAYAEAQIRVIEESIIKYRANKGTIPLAVEGLKHLVTSGVMEHEDFLIDPWGEPVQYQIPSKRSKDRYDIFSKGRNEIAGDDDDIGNWSP